MSKFHQTLSKAFERSRNTATVLLGGLIFWKSLTASLTKTQVLISSTVSSSVGKLFFQQEIFRSEMKSLWIPNYATACAVEDPPRKSKRYQI
ncbi:hypothetical protein TNCV_3054081 [Trichonephila clavipes]|nr:hypothetical protein TNCV_3054081 [Trichonephila clavipes]